MAKGTYADKLRVALECDDWSQAKLVKELAARTGNAPESERSALRGYLRGSVPRPERAAMIAEIMGIPELAVVDDPRRSAAARLEGRLESLEKRLGDILENQKQALSTQTSMLAELEERNDELQRLREVVESLAEAGRSARGQSRPRKAQ